MSLNILWGIIAILLTTLLGFLINRCHNLEKDIKDIRDIRVEGLRKEFEGKLEKKAEKLDDRVRKLEEEPWRMVKDEGSTISFPRSR